MFQLFFTSVHHAAVRHDVVVAVVPVCHGVVVAVAPVCHGVVVAVSVLRDVAVVVLVLRDVAARRDAVVFRLCT
jgi:hypothetical protein